MSAWVSPRSGARVVLPLGSEVVQSFVDVATGYEVIAHRLATGGPAHFILVDPRTGEVVPIERRAREISSEDRVRIDEAHRLRLSTRHTIDPRTGRETLHETLTDLATGAELANGQTSALRSAEDDAADLMARHLEWRAQESAFERTYAAWSFEERATHWYDQMRRRMRWQEESGLDEYAIFTPDAYAEWRAREPEIDRILDVALLRFERSGTRAEIERRLGRASAPPKKPARKRAR